jgi:hypothetical protein
MIKETKQLQSSSTRGIEVVLKLLPPRQRAPGGEFKYNYTSQQSTIHVVKAEEEGSAPGSYKCQFYYGACIPGEDPRSEEVVNGQAG